MSVTRLAELKYYRKRWLKALEARFGPRDTTYEFVGITFDAPDVPRNFFPDGAGSTRVSIQLTPGAAQFREQALFQLAHETLHLLAPTGTDDAPVVEEALATQFADEVARREGWQSQLSPDPVDPKYRVAEKYLVEAQSRDADFVARMRIVEPAFSKWKRDKFLAVSPKLGEALATILCEKFQTWSPPDH